MRGEEIQVSSIAGSMPVRGRGDRNRGERDRKRSDRFDEEKLQGKDS
jgi:hypothetical protein